MANWLLPFDPTCARSKESWDEYGRSCLTALLATDHKIIFAVTGVPQVSIIVVLRNKAHLSLLCFKALREAVDVPYELIIIDNHSNDETQRLLDRCSGAKIIRNTHNLGFGDACMQGSNCAQGELLCFLNNDALLAVGTLKFAICDFSDPTVGCVGGKILLASGELQEAGSIVWSDGSAVGYGRGDDPSSPQYNFRRSVDYCSGAFLLTRRSLFVELGGFDSCYSPAYYEDTDYCMKVWQRGYKVMYEPRSTVHHYESASSGDNEAARPRMAANRRIFVDRWASVLNGHSTPSSTNVLRARLASESSGLRVLYIDDRVPHRSLGAGFPRSNDILGELVKQAHHVTCVPFSFPFESANAEYIDIKREIELLDYHKTSRAVFQRYVSLAHIVWISRPHNLIRFLDDVVESGEMSAKLIFDMEAIFSDRERLSIDLTHRRIPPAIMDSRMHREFVLAKSADAVVVVSERDQDRLRNADVCNVQVLGHCLEAKPTMRAFCERSSFLFVGAVHGPQSPNGDSMEVFCREIWPGVRAKTGAELVIAGFGTDYYLGSLAQDGIRVIGPVADLAPLYDKARVVVVPTRYAAGIPFKAHEAAAFGVPMVVSALIGQQLQWQEDTEVLVASNAQDFVQKCNRLFTDITLWKELRVNGLTRVICELSRQSFGRKVAEIVRSVGF
jgi:O-antigen biosynthesis protein